MNRHLDRLKRGLLALAELFTMALAAGAAIGGIYGGFRLAYNALGPLVVLALMAVALVIYMLGMVDQRDEKQPDQQPEKKD